MLAKWVYHLLAGPYCLRDFGPKYERATLTLGPRQSGKSVYAYLLFRHLLKSGNDTALIDCDIFSPTFRVYQIASPSEQLHIYTTPNASKPESKIPIELFSSYVDLQFTLVREKGVIVVDGLGRHDEATEDLIGRVKTISILCKDGITSQDMEEANFKRGATSIHPFEFYHSRKETVVKLTTYKTGDVASFETQSRTGILSSLDRMGISEGKILTIPENTLRTVGEIAEYLRVVK